MEYSLQLQLSYFFVAVVIIDLVIVLAIFLMIHSGLFVDSIVVYTVFSMVAKHLSNDTTLWRFVCSFVIIKNLHSTVINFNLNSLEFKTKNSIFWAIAKKVVHKWHYTKTIQKLFTVGIRKVSTNAIFGRTDLNLIKLFMKRSQFFLLNLQEKDRFSAFKSYSIISSWRMKTAQLF